jgi:hypothetical protein
MPAPGRPGGPSRAPAPSSAPQVVRQAAHGLRQTPVAAQPGELIDAFWENRLARLPAHGPEAVDRRTWFEAAALEPSRALDLLLRTMI